MNMPKLIKRKNNHVSFIVSLFMLSLREIDGPKILRKMEDRGVQYIYLEVLSQEKRAW